MEKIAIISDIHGNLPALEAVLMDIENREIKSIYCLGDIAGKGPSSAEVVDIIRETCEVVIQGNWDYFMSDTHDNAAMKWHRNKLGPQRIAYLSELPMYKEFYLSGKLMRLCHAAPNDLFLRTYQTTQKEERLKLIEPTLTLNKESDIVGYGDIHSAYIDNFDGKTIFNVGSVGNPLDITQASYAIVEGNIHDRNQSSFAITLVRVPYDINQSIKDAEIANMPDDIEYIKELQTAIYRGVNS
ncbi:MAG: metallophosphoesterase [Lachnotalea sp.]